LYKTFIFVWNIGQLSVERKIRHTNKKSVVEEKPIIGKPCNWQRNKNAKINTL